MTEEKILDEIYDFMDDLHLKGAFGASNLTLQLLHPDEMETDALLAYLTVTLSAAHKLPFRDEFFENVKKELKTRDDWSDDLLAGLE